MAFGEDFLKGFFGSNYLKDYTHASKTFRANGYELAPRQKFLYYVKFNLNTGLSKVTDLFASGNTMNDFGLLVKTVDLPSYNFAVDIQNQYNRKRLVQTQIEYDPVQIVFHDDQSDLVRQLWYNYFSYFYKDPSHSYGNLPSVNGQAGVLDGTGSGKVDYQSRNTYAQDLETPDWGYIGESYSDGTGALPGGGKPRFFNDITIYGFAQQKFAAYTLINPLITSWKHDTYNYEEGQGLMTHTMRVQYESVKYYAGNLNEFQTPSTLAGGAFDPAHYDTERSPLARPGANSTFTGTGGVLDALGAIGGAISDLQAGKNPTASILGAVQAAGTVYQATKGKNLKSVIKEEANTVFKDVIRGQGPQVTRTAMNSSDGFFFGQAPGTNQPTFGQTNGPKSADTSDAALAGAPRVQFVGLEDD